MRRAWDGPDDPGLAEERSILAPFFSAKSVGEVLRQAKLGDVFRCGGSSRSMVSKKRGILASTKGEYTER